MIEDIPIHENTIIGGVISRLAVTPDGGRLLQFVNPTTGRAWSIQYTEAGWKEFQTMVLGIQVAQHVPIIGNGG